MRALPILLATTVLSFAAEPPAPKFRAVTIDDKIQIGYGLAIADVDGDQRPDIILADKKQFVWYQNPGFPPPGAENITAPVWTKFVLAENLTEKDNVCIAAQDIDGDGLCEIAVGAEWNPNDTEKSGAVFFLLPHADRTQRWEAVKLPSEPTTHRMRWVQIEDGKWGLVVVPLHGRGNKNGEGAGVRVLFYLPPSKLDDSALEWKTELIDASLHLTHNFDLPHQAAGFDAALLLAGREAVGYAVRKDEDWKLLPAIQHSAADTKNKGTGHEDFHGAGEVRHGGLSASTELIATIEPMHGNALVAYTLAGDDAKNNQPHTRTVLTDKLSDGHALACGDLTGAGSDQIVVGWRGKPGAAGSTTGVAVWSALDPRGTKWRETMIDPDGMACEDLQLADLNGDGRLDIIAAGRATKNVKIYLNETPR